jgi:two-component system, chemotaxis family, response regulator Rcp1
VAFDPRVELLLIENCPADVRLVMEGLQQSVTPTHLSVVGDGLDALAFLHREGRHATAPRPDLIILDLDLPGKHGREVLREIKGEDLLRSIPVIVLTGSGEPEDILHSYELHANAYITKPTHLDGFLAAVGSIVNFWFQTATPPPNA